MIINFHIYDSYKSIKIIEGFSTKAYLGTQIKKIISEFDDTYKLSVENEIEIYPE